MTDTDKATEEIICNHHTQEHATRWHPICHDCFKRVLRQREEYEERLGHAEEVEFKLRQTIGTERDKFGKRETELMARIMALEQAGDEMEYGILDDLIPVAESYIMQTYDRSGTTKKSIDLIKESISNWQKARL